MSCGAHRSGWRAWVPLCCALALSGCATPSAPGVSNARESSSRYPDEAAASNAFLLSRQADRAYREQRWQDAARDYHRLTEQVPEDAYSWLRLGNSYSRQGAIDRAVDAYEVSIQRNAQDPRPWFNLSMAYLLHAQRAMSYAWRAMEPGDPERALIERRLSALGVLMEVSSNGATAIPASNDRY